MEIELKIGKRIYIFNSEADAETAKRVYGACMGNNRLEDLLDTLRIDFSYALSED